VAAVGILSQLYWFSESMRKAFVVMPFSGRGAQVWDGIASGCRDAGFECTRADSMNSPGFIVTQIYDLINSADVVIGEMSERNPNVFYEIGFAHALGKPTILVASSDDDLKTFDTAGFRHHLHGGNPSEVRRILFNVLTDIEREFAVDVIPPESVSLYEWLSESNIAPRFTWRSQKEESHLQIDRDGGQRVLESSSGRLIAITNTEDFWNHRLNYSIMRLAAPRDLANGDIVHLFLEGRSGGPGRFDFVGDGGVVTTPTGRVFTQAWRDQRQEFGKSVRWIHWHFAATVNCLPEYDLKWGVAIYLLTSLGRATVFLRSIRLFRRRITP
jgi:hypothetical protein